MNTPSSHLTASLLPPGVRQLLSYSGRWWALHPSHPTYPPLPHVISPLPPPCSLVFPQVYGSSSAILTTVGAGRLSPQSILTISLLTPFPPPQVYGSSSAILEDGGRWTLDKIKQLTAGGGSIEGQVEEITRRNIFRKELERSITDGEGREGGGGRRREREGEITYGEEGRWRADYMTHIFRNELERSITDGEGGRGGKEEGEGEGEGEI